MLDTDKNRLFTDKTKGVKMRLYGQGLGDCFLFAFPRKGDTTGKNPVYLVIDCGVAMSTPDKNVRIKQVVNNIRDATGGHIDVLALTHQHFDHISAFTGAREEWNKITVDALYLPWTERAEATKEHGGIKDFRDILEKASKKALEKAASLGMLDATPGFRAEGGFLGVALPDAETGATPEEDLTPMDEAMIFARQLSKTTPLYLEPGDVFRVPDTDFHGHVLGPPRARPEDVYRDKNGKETKYIELLVDDDPDVMYSYGPPLNMKVDDGKPGGANAFGIGDDHSLPALASGLLAADALADAQFREGDEGFCPFAPEIRLDWENAMASHFFQKHYGDIAKEDVKDNPAQYEAENGKWRRVDNDWLLGAASLALRAGDFTNNISLVLAFDIPESKKMLLFPGDAQVGNWLSWHTIKGWKTVGDANLDNAPQPDDKKTLMQNLLGRVAFYKVGHHGSHNATIKEKGLEMMTRDDLMAFIPVSVPVAQDYMGYCPMPFYPVVKALQARAKAGVLLPNGRLVGDAPLPLPPNVKKSTDLDPALCIAPILKTDKKGAPILDGGKPIIIEEAVPLYLEVTIEP